MSLNHSCGIGFREVMRSCDPYNPRTPEAGTFLRRATPNDLHGCRKWINIRSTAAEPLDPTQLAGADQAGRVMLYTPNPFQGGSSVSHWDTSAFHNLLMEPAINADLTQSVVPPQDLTFPMFKDIGW